MESSIMDRQFHCPPPQPPAASMTMDRRWRANIDPAPNCPRCASANTKFCYYNNYSLSQPRFFCKGCKRYWTRGGSLRNVPVGGGCRKSRRSRSTRGSTSVTGLNTSPNSSSPDCSQDSGGDIDMAAVFAKFLNHDQTSSIVSTEVTNTTSSDVSNDSLSSSISCPMFPVDILEQESSRVMEPVQEEGTLEGFMNPDHLGSFDDFIEDVFWSDDSNNNVSSLTWQPTLLPEDQYKVSADLLFTTDNWSYFDNTGFEISSRP